jgi:hypothetical protein
MAPVAIDPQVTRIALGDPLRDGYSGMLVVTGRSAPPG